MKNLFTIITMILFFFSCEDQLKRNDEFITKVIEHDNLIGFEINSGKIVIHELYRKPFRNIKKLKTKSDSLNDLRKNNFLKIKTFHSNIKGIDSWAEEYYDNKPDWKKIISFNNEFDYVNSVTILVNDKEFLRQEYNMSGQVIYEDSKFLIEFKRIAKDMTCVFIEQPGYDLMENDYRLFVNLTTDSLNNEMKNICDDEKIGEGKFCVEHSENCDSLKFICKLIKSKLEAESKEVQQILESNLNMDTWIKVPKENSVLKLR